jgi:hypothetical protein
MKTVQRLAAIRQRPTIGERHFAIEFLVGQSSISDDFNFVKMAPGQESFEMGATAEFQCSKGFRRRQPRLAVASQVVEQDSPIIGVRRMKAADPFKGTGIEIPFDQ